MESKKFYLSKTFWIGFLTALAPAIPGAMEELAKNPDLIVSTLGAIIMILRFVTKDKVVIS